MAQTAIKTADDEFLATMAGNGLEDISSKEMSTGFLSMVQPNSSATLDGHEAGTWRNSATGDNYGSSVRVIPVKFSTIWNERNNEAPFATVKRALPGGISVETKAPKNGKGYPKMYDTETGLEVQELYVYGVVLPEHPEAGVLFFNPTVGTMRMCKSWNSQLKSQLLSNGQHAPLFGYSWILSLEVKDNPKQAGGKVTALTKIVKDVMTDRDTFETVIKPVLEQGISNQMLISADEEAVE